MAKKKAAKKKVTGKTEKTLSKPKKKAAKPKKKATAAAKPKKIKKADAAPALTADDVRVAAYLRFEARVANGEPGDELGDWLAVEGALKVE